MVAPDQESLAQDLPWVTLGFSSLAISNGRFGVIYAQGRLQDSAQG
jgi:hypothetical protein